MVHRSPAWFRVDDGKRTLEPVGLKGRELSALVSFVVANQFFLDEINNRLTEMGITVSGFFSTPTGEAMLYLPEDDRDRMAVLMDIGYLNTELMVVEGDAVVMAVGVTPDTALARDAGLELNEKGAIVVDPSYRTSDPDIYAVGDAIQVYSALTDKPMQLALAGPAQKQARQAADSICGRPVRNTGYIGSSCIKVFDYNAASTGLTAAQCEKAGIPYDFVYVMPPDRVSLMPGSTPLHYKLIYQVPTGRVLGVQAISKGDAPKRADIAATLIKFGGTVDDLRDLELCYAPPFSTAKDAGNNAALVACNLLEGAFRQVKVSQVRGLVESGACIIDVREPGEYAKSHIKTAVNIPLSQLRSRLEEVPRDRPVYLHCRSSQRSYNACLCLQAHGFTNVYNISGSYLGISFYEYFNDVTQGREPILTDYNFN